MPSSTHRSASAAFLALGIAFVLAGFVSLAAAQTIPAELPRPDGKPPVKDKPVKVYIMSGQSNMVGFGTLDGGAAAYPSIFLSSDPSIKPGRMPEGASGLLPFKVYPTPTGEAIGATLKIFKGPFDPAADYSKLKADEETTIKLGHAEESLPNPAGPHTFMAQAFVEVPITGMHEVYVGHGDSSYAIATINGKEVYRRDIGGEAQVTKIQLEKGKRHPLTIIYLKGGSTVFWMALVDLQPQGTLRSLVKQGKFPAMVDDEGNWTQRSDVILNDAYLGNGSSKPLSPTANGKTFGPELGFGYVMGEFHDEPVLLIKSDIGNRSLAWDILPPGSERYVIDGTVYAGYKDGQSSWPVEQGEPKQGGWYAGKQYDDYTAAIHRELKAFGEKYPQFKDQGYEIAGFVWWQGHKDQNPVHASRYEQNMAHLIRTWRKEFNAPDAKWVIATIAFEGWKLDGPGKMIAEAQLAVSGDSGKYPEFKGNVKTIEARDFWRTLGESPSSKGYHYNHNAETYMLVGDAMGRAMAQMMGATVEPRVLEPRPVLPESWPANPTLEQAAQMLYTDAFISPWVKDPAKPTAEDYARMQPALRPIILDKLIPQAAGAAGSVPGYLRKGAPLQPLVTGEGTGKPGSTLEGQLDQIISLYNAAGVHDYDWKKFGPDMDSATWHYHSFDPAEQPDPKSADRYRKITMPQGMDNWFAVDFDPTKAGWKLGKAPFGQNDGKLVALRGTCNSPQCKCDVAPQTLWEKEVLLMQQTFELPALKDDHRYRLVVGGGSHGWSGEGFAVYVNGKLFAEMTGGFYKSGGTRGAYVFNDFLPDFKSGKVTIAVKAFLRQSHYRNQPAPPSGHMSVWLEEALLPQPVLQLKTAKQE